MGDWQPIETAPKDGASILVYGEISDTDMVRFNGASRAVSGYYDAVDQAFCVSGATWLGPFVKATHWQPLPDAPEASS